MRDAFGVERVSKIAMRPVYHGTSTAGATKLRRYIKAKDTTKSSFKFVTGKPRADGTRGNAADDRPQGLYTTTDRHYASTYAVTGRSPDRGGLLMNGKKGKVLTFNSVGAKAKYRTSNEEIYDPKDLGAPLAAASVKRSSQGKDTMRRIQESDKKLDADIVRDRARGIDVPYLKTSKEIQALNRKRVLGYKPKKRSFMDNLLNRPRDFT